MFGVVKYHWMVALQIYTELQFFNYFVKSASKFKDIVALSLAWIDSMNLQDDSLPMNVNNINFLEPNSSGLRGSEIIVVLSWQTLYLTIFIVFK